MIILHPDKRIKFFEALKERGMDRTLILSELRTVDIVVASIDTGRGTSETMSSLSCSRHDEHMVEVPR